MFNSTELKIASINIARIHSDDSRLILLRYCREESLDVIALQEVSFPSCALLEQDYEVFTNMGPGRRGTAFLVRHPVRHPVPYWNRITKFSPIWVQEEEARLSLSVEAFPRENA